MQCASWLNKASKLRRSSLSFRTSLVFLASESTYTNASGCINESSSNWGADFAVCRLLGRCRQLGLLFQQINQIQVTSGIFTSRTIKGILRASSRKWVLNLKHPQLWGYWTQNKPSWKTWIEEGHSLSDIRKFGADRCCASSTVFGEPDTILFVCQVCNWNLEGHAPQRHVLVAFPMESLWGEAHWLDNLVPSLRILWALVKCYRCHTGEECSLLTSAFAVWGMQFTSQFELLCFSSNRAAG